jgi:acyl-coenzyme A thioesterase PaaI-like protein
MANWGVDLVNSLRNKTARPLSSTSSSMKACGSTRLSTGASCRTGPQARHFAMPDGFVQGGLFGTIADISQGVAMLTTQDQFENWATLDFHIRFMRLVRVGEVVRIESTVVNKSRNNAVIETTFAPVGGKLLAVGQDQNDSGHGE